MEFCYTIPLQKHLKMAFPLSKPTIDPFFCWAVHTLTVQGRKAVLAMNRNLMDSLVRGNGQDINGQHQAPGEVGEVGNHAVLDVAGVLPEEQDAAHLAAHLEVVRPKAHTVQGDAVLEMVARASSTFFRETETVMYLS